MDDLHNSISRFPLDALSEIPTHDDNDIYETLSLPIALSQMVMEKHDTY